MGDFYEEVRAAGNHDRGPCTNVGIPASENKKAAIVYIENEEGRLLCVWNKRFGGWGLPGGKVEPGETALAAAARELKEETGLLPPGTFNVFYEAPGCVESDVDVVVCRGVGNYVLDADKDDDRDPFDHIKTEPGCPHAWLEFEELTRASNPFAPFYRTFFKKHPIEPKVRFEVSATGLVRVHVSTQRSIIGVGDGQIQALKSLAASLAHHLSQAEADVRDLERRLPDPHRASLEKTILKEAREAHRLNLFPAQSPLAVALNDLDALDVPF